MQAHSCKSPGDDTQFMYDLSTKAIMAVNYDGACSAGTGGCLTIIGAPTAGSRFKVASCVNGSTRQTFTYGNSGEFGIDGGNYCLAVSASSRAGGRFSLSERGGTTKDLVLANCSITDYSLKSWRVIDSLGGAVDGGFTTVTTTKFVLMTTTMTDMPYCTNLTTQNCTNSSRRPATSAASATRIAELYAFCAYLYVMLQLSLR